MAQKPHLIDHAQRELRQRTYLAAATIDKKFPAAGEIAVELRFADPERKLFFSPYKRIFAPEMQAFFAFHCPDKTCVGGGFEIGDQISRSLANKGISGTGSASCQGRRKRADSNETRCLLELNFNVAALGRRESVD